MRTVCRNSIRFAN